MSTGWLTTCSRPSPVRLRTAQALATINALLQQVGDDQTHPLLSLLALLADRVEAFGRVASPVPPAPPHRVLVFLME
jgi:HTH-type transcriptional regulator / antitoxin HigA